MQSPPSGSFTEVLNRSKHLQLRGRWRGRFWNFIVLSLKNTLSQFVCLLGIKSDDLGETGEGRNKRPWLILLTMLSMGESQDVSNGPGMQQEAGIWTRCSQGVSHSALGQKCCNLNRLTPLLTQS